MCSIFMSCGVFLAKPYFNSYPAMSTYHEHVEVALWLMFFHPQPATIASQSVLR